MQEVVAAAAIAAGAVCLLAALGVRPRPRAAWRLRPYNSGNRVRLGGPADEAAVDDATAGQIGAVAAALRPLVGGMQRLLDRESDRRLGLLLRHAGAYPQLPADQRLVVWRADRLRTAVVWTAAGAVPGVLAASGLLTAVGLACGAVWGAAWPRARLGRQLDRRRAQIRADLYEACHHLAVYLETGLTVGDALRRLVGRAGGPLVDELAEVLRRVRAGVGLPDALEHAAALTAEPFAARTLRALARVEQTGVPLSDALRQLAEEVRAHRRDLLRRHAVARRVQMVAAMVLLLPPLLLLAGAPLVTIFQIGR